ncbi:MAG: permease [Lentisphaerota bacterium]
MVAESILRLPPGCNCSSGAQFFIEETIKIFLLLTAMIYVIAWLRASLNIEKVRDYLKGKNRFLGYVAAAGFGAVTPFCSCSSIPLFLGFTLARIPVGISMAFLITSPMINEAAVVMLAGMLGVKLTLIYVTFGMLAGILGGIFFDLIKAEDFLTFNVDATQVADNDNPGIVCCKLSFCDRHSFAVGELKDIMKRIWLWIVIGVGIGAFLHGFVPQSYIVGRLGGGQWWSVPAAVCLGIPLYSNATGVIPVIDVLIRKGLPAGTALAFMMSTVAASLPEFVMLKQVMKTRLLVYFFIYLLIFFTLSGWILNLAIGVK